ncbi:hypothetical protein NE235_23720 [Actinoallomurus spadix]|uniref:Oligosaccharide repeat unit polymerase n=1 Tax=Actinoallomurus spadix TaxID=79912 RepID=A0ABP3GRW5_9ACTN|nr:hypothetical protein [Actinoallomurus spadix]MCO5989121.1 hypothetical protein [Actinoallomurus spadix]
MSVLPCLAVTCLIPADDFVEWWRTSKYFDGTDAVLTLLLLSAFIVGTLVPNLTHRRIRKSKVLVTPGQQQVLVRAGRTFLALTLIGYVAWAMAAVSRGYGLAALHSTLSLEPRALVTAKLIYFATVPGVTTLTQFGPLALICLLLNRRIGCQRHTWELSALIGASLTRVFFNAERIALMEMAVPLIVLTAATLPSTRRPRRTWIWAMMPLLAPVALGLFFGAFEYTRSWNDFYAQHSDTGFGGFIMRRLGGYYATASNNSIILLDHYPSSSLLPQFTLPFLWGFPIVRSFLRADSGFVSGLDTWSSLLMRYGNPEFTNDGGILPAIADFGLAGALIWWSAVGLLIGICYRAMRSGQPSGLIFYSVTYIGVLEMGLLFYWGLGRAFPVLAGGLVTWALLHRTRLREN